MSLINDALRRASQNTKREPNEIPNMQPNLRQAPKSGGPGMLIILICFVLAGAATLGVWAYWNKKYKNAKPAEATTGAKPAATTNNNPIAKAAGTLTKVQTANKEGEAAAAAMQTPAPAPAPTPAATQPAPKAVPQPQPAAARPNDGSPRVQAIFYSANNPSAMINGRTVRNGDTLDGMVILQIKPKSVQVQTAQGVKELTIK